MLNNKKIFLVKKKKLEVDINRDYVRFIYKGMEYYDYICNPQNEQEVYNAVLKGLIEESCCKILLTDWWWLYDGVVDNKGAKVWNYAQYFCL